MKLFFWLIVLCFWGSIKLLAQGLTLNDSAYSALPQKKSILVVSPDGLPEKVDLSVYVPTVIDQGKLGTCVGISSAYYLRTMLEAIRRNITDKDSIDALRFSPSFLYNSIKDPSDKNCVRGTEIAVALEFMKNYGVETFAKQGYPYCVPKQTVRLDSTSKIMDYIRLFGLNDRQENIVTATQKALSENSPVLIAIQTTPSFDNLGFWSKLWVWFLRFFGFDTGDFGLWKPSKSKSLEGGHAVCVVGYDNAKFGGAFQVVNSWGKNWGDDGFFWIRYQDYSQYTKYAYQAYLPVENGEKALLSGTVSIKLANLRDTELPFLRQIPDAYSNSSEDLVAYSLRDPQPTDTEYKFSINVDKQTYLYVLGANANQQQADKLFPVDSISPIIGSNTKVILPSEEQVYALNKITGTEYWLFLFSENELKIDSCLNLINTSKGTFVQRVQAVFDSTLVDYKQVDYKTKRIGFELKGKHEGTTVPLLIKLKHVRKRRLR